MSSIFSQTAQGIGVFIPAGSDSNEGDSYIPVGSPAIVRLQVLYDASLFKDLLGGGGFLRTIYLRADQLAGGNVVGVLTGVEITASTSQKDILQFKSYLCRKYGFGCNRNVGFKVYSTIL